jgi:hypothetical protein
MRIERLARSRGGTPIQNIDTVLASTELGITVSRKTIRCPAVPLWTALIGCAHLPRSDCYGMSPEATRSIMLICRK